MFLMKNRLISKGIARFAMTLMILSVPVSVWSTEPEFPANPFVDPIQEYNSQENTGDAIPGYQGLMKKAVNRGRVPVIVKLMHDDPLKFSTDEKRLALHRQSLSAIQDRVVNRIESARRIPGKIQGLKRFRYTPAIAFHADPDELETLIQSPDVVEIFEDKAVPPTLTDSVPLIGADNSWSFNGYTGQGQVVAILDTGVDKTHPFLSGKVVSEACYSSSNEESSSLCPGGYESTTAVGSGVDCATSTNGCGHGTHVAGIAAGNGGVASDADIVAIQVFSRFFGSDCTDEGYDSPCALTWESDQVRGLERIVELRNSFNIASVNMSLGRGEYTSPCDSSPQKSLIDALKASGIATVIASGNDGYVDALGSPACISSAVSVGSSTKTDRISEFSNNAYFLDLLAPGSGIYSSIKGGGFEAWNGTSMAAPHVAGAWAVLKQANPDAGVDDILNALISTGSSIADDRAGAGGRVKPRIRVDRAVWDSDQSTVILTRTSPNHTVTSGSDIQLFGTAVSNQITLESGAKAELINFPGFNTVQIQSSSEAFQVSRSGTVVTFEGTDGTRLKMPATASVQTITFSDRAPLTLSIYQGRVLLDHQVITITPASIEGSHQEPLACGAYMVPGVWKEFDCYNLAAIGKTTNDDPFTPSWRLIGGYWQWGRKGPDPSQWYDANTPYFAHGPTGPSENVANSGDISGWDQTEAPDGSWKKYQSRAIYHLLDQDADLFNTDINGDGAVDLLAAINTNGLKFTVDGGAVRDIGFDKTLLTDKEILNHADFVDALQDSLTALIAAGDVPDDIILYVDETLTDFSFLDDGSYSSSIPAIVLETQTGSILEPAGFKWVEDLSGEYNVYGRLSSDSSSADDQSQCPSGFKVPTRSQWEGVLSNNTQSIAGTWSSSATNYSSARFFGEKLMLPAAGYRDVIIGALGYRGYQGFYWSSSEHNSYEAWNIGVLSGYSGMASNKRRYGFSVRCISE